jgi:hypothetical protein
LTTLGTGWLKCAQINDFLLIFIINLYSKEGHCSILSVDQRVLKCMFIENVSGKAYKTTKTEQNARSTDTTLLYIIIIINIANIIF